MKNFILFTLLLLSVSKSSADFIYSGLDFTELNFDNLNEENLLVIGGINININSLSSIAVELGVDDLNDNGATLKLNLLYNYSFSNVANLKPFVSTGISSLVYEDETCVYIFSSGINCSSKSLTSTGIIFAIGSEIKVSKKNIYLLKLSISKDKDNNNFISLLLAKEF